MVQVVGSQTKNEVSHRRPLQSWQWLFLILIFASSLLVRRVGLSFGAPLFTHPDEQNILIPVVESVRLGKNVYNYAHPTQVSFRLNKVLLNTYSQLHNGFDLAEWYDRDLYGVYLGSRSITMVAGALLPILAFFIGRRFKPDFSLPSAILVAFFPSFVLHSHYITPDVLNTFFTLAVMLCCLLWLEGKGQVWLWLAVISAALNTAEKYPGLLSLLLVAASLLIQALRQHWPFKQLFKTGILVLFGFVLTLFVFAPNLFFDYREVIEMLIVESTDSHLGSDGLNWPLKMAFYGRSFWSSSNVWTLIFFIIGIFGLIRSRQSQAWLFSYGFIYMALLSFLGLHHERWALPAYPSVLLPAAFGVSYLLEKVKPFAWARVAIQIAASLMLGLNLLGGVTESVYMDLPDTSVIGLQYLNEQKISPDQTVYEGYTPFAPIGKLDIYDFDFDHPGDIDYAILSSKIYERYQAEPCAITAKMPSMNALHAMAI
jgi:hypothetical protein